MSGASGTNGEKAPLSGTAGTRKAMSHNRTMGLVGFFAFLTFVFIYLLVRFWPSDAAKVTDMDLIVIAVLAGGLGGTVHGISSLVMYRGEEKLWESWFLWYALRPFTASSMGFIVYCALRAGFWALADESVGLTAFGTAAVAGVTGMFTYQVTQKLRDALDAFLGIEKKEKDGVVSISQKLDRTPIRDVPPRSLERLWKSGDSLAELTNWLKEKVWYWFVPIVDDEGRLTTVISDEAVWRYLVDKDVKAEEKKVSDVLAYIDGAKGLERAKDIYVEIGLENSVLAADDLMATKGLHLCMVTEEGKPTHFITKDDIRRVLGLPTHD